jgi:hypothetical protein
MASSVDAKLLKSTKFPAEFNQKVDMQKVNVEVMKKSVLQIPNRWKRRLILYEPDGLLAKYQKYSVQMMTL